MTVTPKTFAGFSGQARPFSGMAGGEVLRGSQDRSSCCTGVLRAAMVKASLLSTSTPPALSPSASLADPLVEI
jgi:hypothetical protein